MNRLVIAFVGVSCLSVVTSNLYGQSGSRSPVSSISTTLSSSSVGSDAVRSNAAIGRFSRIPFQNRSASQAERVSRQRAQTALNNSQANAARALEQRNIQSSRKAYYEGQVAKQSQLISYRNQQEQEAAVRRERNIENRQQRERDRAAAVANLKIQWPHGLQSSQYRERVDEIEAFAKLHVSLSENDGVEAGFHAAVRGLALQIMQDERNGTMSDSESKEVRAFVRALNKNYGQFPSMMEQPMTDTGMLVMQM